MGTAAWLFLDSPSASVKLLVPVKRFWELILVSWKFRRQKSPTVSSVHLFMSTSSGLNKSRVGSEQDQILWVTYGLAPTLTDMWAVWLQTELQDGSAQIVPAATDTKHKWHWGVPAWFIYHLTQSGGGAICQNEPSVNILVRLQQCVNPSHNKVSAQDLDHEICIHCHFDWVIIWSNGVGPISKSVTYFSRCLAGNQISISVPFVRTIKTEPTRWVQTQLWRSSSIKFNRRSAEEIDLFFCASASIFIQLCSHLMEKLTLNHIFILLMEKHSCLRFFNQFIFFVLTVQLWSSTSLLMLFLFLADMSYLIIQPAFLRLSPAPGDVTHCLGKRFTGSTFQSLWFHVGWERRAGGLRRGGERSGEFLMRIFRVGAASGDVRRRLHLCHPVTDIKYPPELDWRRSINHKCVLLLQQQQKKNSSAYPFPSTVLPQKF